MLSDLAFPSATEHTTLRSFLDEQMEFFIESMQDAADNQWHLITENYDPDHPYDVGVEMTQWWNRETRRFRNELRRAYRQEKAAQIERRLEEMQYRNVHRQEQANAEIEHLKSVIRQLEIDLHHEKGTVAMLDGILANWKEPHLCRACHEPL